jgi:2-oxo-4-hydroxy-4-carboxy--5-ureidoimidazoline (OHCU) decarboxylase
MSPYQQDVIGSTLQEYDIQAQKGLPALAAQAIGAGAFGGGREGVQRAEYQSASDRNRAALQAQLLQQGFGQAQQLAAQQYGQQMNLAQQAPALAGQQISALTTLGGLQQAQAQAGLSAQQQLAQQQLMQPLTSNTGSGFRNHFIDCWISRFNTNNNATISNTFTNCFRCRCYISRNI